MFIFFESFARRAGFALTATLTLAAMGCQPQVANNANKQPVAPTNSAATPSASPTPERSGGTAVTLPMLDALFADTEFVKEARASVQLTDEEVMKLREASRKAVLELSDDAADDDARSTAAAVRQAHAQIEKVLGRERTERFVALVDSFTSGGEVLAGAANSVPADTRIVVNAPAYRMDVFKEGKLARSYKIGIGYPEFPLPTGLRKASSIIFNPEWTPPDEPWVKGKYSPGEKVEAGSKLNPLGIIKIPIGLPSLIHGGKSPARLGTFASHGCVGLTDQQVREFALQLASLAGTELTQADIATWLKNREETKEVKLDKPLAVELRYETIVVEDGTLKIYRDVYERGTNTEDELRRVLDTYGVSLDSLQPQMRRAILDGLKQMAVDAGGAPVDEANAGNANKEPANASGQVTRNIKGKKELVFKLTELAGKGYPAAAK